MKGTGVCLPLFSWGTASGFGEGGGGGDSQGGTGVVLFKRDGGVWGRILGGG